MKRALIIDVQHNDMGSFPDGDKKYYLRKWLDEETPVHIALTPYQRSLWKDLESDIWKLTSRAGSGIFLEGLIHTCSLKNHKIRDPHHEHICTSLFQKSAPYFEQAEDIGSGINFLRKIFGISPAGFVPPQHLWNRNTLDAVRNS